MSLAAEIPDQFHANVSWTDPAVEDLVGRLAMSAQLSCEEYVSQRFDQFQYRVDLHRRDGVDIYRLPISVVVHQEP